MPFPFTLPYLPPQPVIHSSSTSISTHDTPSPHLHLQSTIAASIINFLDDSTLKLMSQDNSIYTSTVCSPTAPLLNPIKGDLHHIKEPDVFRFLYKNINGLRIMSFDKWMATVIRMRDLHCDLVGLNETCTNWKLNKIKQRCQQILQKIFTNSSIIVSTNSISSTKPYLPGGTASISLGNWNSKILHPIYDPSNMGHWTGATYCLSDTRKFHTITAYRVCPNHLTIKILFHPMLSRY
jgi:hypothetical protein